LARKGLIKEAIKVLKSVTALNSIHNISIRNLGVKASWRDLFNFYKST